MLNELCMEPYTWFPLKLPYLYTYFKNGKMNIQDLFTYYQMLLLDVLYIIKKRLKPQPVSC